MTAAITRTHCSSDQSRRANTMNGQCHRYQEYERSPIRTKTERSRNLVVPVREPKPLTITRAAPHTGRRATTPGIG